MKRNSMKNILCILLSALLVILAAVPAFASNLDDLLSQTEGLEEYLRELTTDMKTLSLEYEYIQGKIDDVELKIASNEVLLEDSQEACDLQYDLMKKRIVYLYESGNTNYLTALLSSDSLGDILNQFEYINNIVGYDRDMLDKYTDLVTTVNTLQSDLLTKKAELEGLRKTALDNMSRAAAVATASTEKITEYGISEEDANEVIRNYMDENGDEIMAQLQQSIAVAQAENPDYDILADYGSVMDVVMADYDLSAFDWSAYAVEQTYEEPQPQEQEVIEIVTEPEPETTAADTTQIDEEAIAAVVNNSDYSADDAYLIAALVSGEVGYLSYDTQRLVAQMIVNRLNSPDFPDTVEEVINQPGQFNYWDEYGNEIRSDTYFRENGPFESALEATNEVLDGYYDPSFPYMGAVTEDFYYSYPEYFVDTYGEIIEGGYFFNFNWQ